jgi:hypothetical protein
MLSQAGGFDAACGPHVASDYDMVAGTQRTCPTVSYHVGNENGFQYGRNDLTYLNQPTHGLQTKCQNKERRLLSMFCKKQPDNHEKGR